MKRAQKPAEQARHKHAMPRRFAWASLPDEELLQLRLKDLKVTVEGTWLQGCLDDLYDELASARTLRIRPHAWISSEWFSPDDTPGIAIPFYLAHPRLTRLERKMIIDVEGGTVPECMRILRHEAGHVVQHAYQLHSRRRWQQLFGPSSKRYPSYYRPKPTSKRYVQHLPLWYAQSHPDEDFAETLRSVAHAALELAKTLCRLAGLKKLQYVDELMAEIAGQRPMLTHRLRVDPLNQLTDTLAEHYQEEAGPLLRQLQEDIRPGAPSHLLRRSQAQSIARQPRHSCGRTAREFGRWSPSGPKSTN